MKWAVSVLCLANQTFASIMSEFHQGIYQLLNETHQILAKTTPPLSQTSSRTPNQIKHSNKTIKQPYIIVHPSTKTQDKQYHRIDPNSRCPNYKNACCYDRLLFLHITDIPINLKEYPNVKRLDRIINII